MGKDMLSKARYLEFGEDAFIYVLENGRKVGGRCGIRVRGKKGLESERTKHFFLEEKEEEGFCKAPSSKNVLGMRVRNFLFLNFLLLGRFKLKREVFKILVLSK